MSWLICLLKMGMPIALATAAVDQTAQDFVICRSQKAVRTIRIVPSEDKGCKITYTKAGVDEIVGGSRFSNGCQTVMENIRKNLESSNWKCKAVKQAQLTFGTQTLGSAKNE